MSATVAIVNPKSANGKTARNFERVLPHLPGVEVLYTEAPGHAIELTADALRRGARTIAAVGGDGTINEVVNGFIHDDRPINPQARMLLIPCGTGSDFRRTLNTPFDTVKAAKLLETGEPQSIDVMKVKYTTLDGRTARRYAINLTSFGMGGAVAARANRTSKALGGQVSFLVATLLTTLEYPGRSVTIRIDDNPPIETNITNVAVGNGQYHGGGMWICPGAALDDGQLDVTVIRYLGLFELIRNIPTMYNGSIYSHPKARSYRARRIFAESRETTLIEVDGEPLGKLPIEISVIPQAIQVLL